MPTGQQYGTNVPQTTLTAGINGTATSFGVASLSGWPATPFTAVLDIGTTSQEPIDVTTVSGNTITLCTRNIDGTTAFSHGVNATLTHADIGRDFREARTHIDASTGVHGIAGAVVGTTDTQTLFAKTLSGPIVTTATPPTPTGSNLGFSSNAGVLTVNDAAGNFSQVTLPQGNAELHKLVACTFDPLHATSNAGFGSGTVHMQKVNVPVLSTVSNIFIIIQSGGSGLSNNFVGLYNSAGTRIAVSADQSSSWITNGVKSAAVGPVTLEPGDYWVAFLMNGTGVPGVVTAGAPSISGVYNLNLTAAQSRRGTFSSGLTALPASITMSSIAPDNNPVWMGLS